MAEPSSVCAVVLPSVDEPGPEVIEDPVAVLPSPVVASDEVDEVVVSVAAPEGSVVASSGLPVVVSSSSPAPTSEPSLKHAASITKAAVAIDRDPVRNKSRGPSGCAEAMVFTGRLLGQNSGSEASAVSGGRA
jgi:hypothetical protein